MKTAATIGTGPIENSPDQKVTHVEAGTHGRLLRLCMNVARRHPQWRAVGAIETIKRPGGKTILRQRLERD